MVTKLYIADVKLNPTDNKYTKKLLIENENGVLMINRGLFSISFMNEEAITLTNVEVINKKHIGDITL